MSRNASGTYSLPAGNPVVTNTTITSSWANTTLSDVANELTNSLDRNGRGRMTVPFLLLDGTVTAPTMGFISESNTGWYRPGAGQIAITILGTQKVLYNATDTTLAGNMTVTGDVAVGDDLGVVHSLTVGTTAAIGGNLSTNGTFVANGAATLSSTLLVGSNATVTGNATVSGTLAVNGASATLPQTTSIGTTTATELGYVHGVTSAIQAQLDGKVVASGSYSWTGTNDFSVGTIRVPTQVASDNTTKAASTAFVQSVAFNTALPSQTGNAGKYVGTDGVTASWTAFPATASQAEMAAGTEVNIRQMSPSLVKYAIAQASNSGKSFPLYVSGQTLPDLSAVTPSGQNVAVMQGSNIATAVANFLTSDGWTITTGWSNATIGLLTTTYAGTAHGVWGSSAAAPPSVAISGVTAIACKGVAQLTSTLYVALLTASASGGYYVAAIDTSTATPTVGAAVQISAGTFNNSGCTIYAVSSTSFVAVTDVGTSAAVAARAGSVSGTTITLGSATSLGSLATGNPTPSAVLQLSSSQYVAKIHSTGGGQVVAFSVSGTTVTAGSGVAIGSTADATITNSHILIVDASTFAMAYLSAGGGTASTRLFNVRTGSISANAITLNAAVNTASNTQGDAKGILYGAKLGSSYVWACEKGATASTDIRAITIAATVPTIGAATNRTDANLFDATMQAQTFNYPGYICGPIRFWITTPDPAILYNNSSVATVACITASGTAVTVNTVNLAGAPSGLLLAGNGTSMFASSATLLSRITIAAGVPSVAETATIATTAKVAWSGTQIDVSVKYGSTWYVWNFSPAMIPGGMITTAVSLSNTSGAVVNYNIS